MPSTMLLTFVAWPRRLIHVDCVPGSVIVYFVICLTRCRSLHWQIFAVVSTKPSDMRAKLFRLKLGRCTHPATAIDLWPRPRGADTWYIVIQCKHDSVAVSQPRLAIPLTNACQSAYIASRQCRECSRRPGSRTVHDAEQPITAYATRER